MTLAHATSRRGWSMAAGMAMSVLVAACGSSSSTGTAASSTSTTTAAPTSPGTAFSSADVAGLGTVVVDARGRTVYVLTTDGRTNLPCDDSSGCTKVWPDLPLPDGTTPATAGAGLQASLLGTMKLADGETYPTYKGWLMYEFANDTAAGQGHGEGITSFGGTWYALNATGSPVTGAAPAAVETPTPTPTKTVTAPVKATPTPTPTPTTIPPTTTTQPPATEPPTTEAPTTSTTYNYNGY